LAIMIGLLVWTGTTGSGGGDAICNDPRSGTRAC
jgi:hypothetical protein